MRDGNTRRLVLQAQSDTAVDHAMTLYRDVVRRLLKVTKGYECQEADGNFMLAFHQPVKALHFCLLVCTVLLCSVFCATRYHQWLICSVLMAGMLCLGG